MVTITIIVTAIVTIIVSNGNNYTTKMALLAAFVSINIYHRNRTPIFDILIPRIPQYTNTNTQEYDTWSPPMTRSRRKGIIAQKSTRFIGCLKNRNFRGEQMNLLNKV